MTIPDARHDSFVRMTTDAFGIGDDGNTLYGYLAVFDQDTRINNWEGDFIERIAPGAFSKTLSERGDRVKILYDHGLDPSIGNKPLGKASVMREDDHGLYVEVPLDDTSYNRDLKASLASGAIDGMSFRFSVQREDWDMEQEPNRRTLREVVLMEGGPVTFPAYEGAAAGIRSADDLQAWRAGHTHTTDTVSSDADIHVTSDTTDDAPPLVAPVNPARQVHTQLHHQLMKVRTAS